MNTIMRTAFLAVIGLLLPCFVHAQDDAGGMHVVLDQLYDEMMPLCSQLIGVGQGIAGFAATWYIGSRIWQHIARAEPIDFYPLFRPFVLGFCIMIFPSVLGLINGVMKPTVTATAAMVEGSNKSIKSLLDQRMQAIRSSKEYQMYIGDDLQGDKDKWYRYTHDGADPSDQSVLESIGNDFKFQYAKATYAIRSQLKRWLSEVLALIFTAAALCIDTLRTFQMIVLAILGPFVFGLAVFDGFQHSLTNWLARYINIFLWLPVANIFGSIIGKIQEMMIRRDIAEIVSSGDTVFDSFDTAYIVFLLIAIIGYTTVPSVASFIVNAGASGALQQKVSNLFGSTSSMVVNTASHTAGGLTEGMGNIIKSGMNPQGTPEQHTHMKDKLKGNA